MQSQLLTQLPRPSTRQQQAPLPSPQMNPSSLQTASLVGAVTTGGTLPVPRPPGIHNQSYQTFQSSALSRLNLPTLPITPQLLNYSTLNVGVGSSTLHQHSQLQSALLLQQQQQQLQQQVQRGLTLPARTGGPELTPPPAKRHAMDAVSYRSTMGLPPTPQRAQLLLGAAGLSGLGYPQPHVQQLQQQASYMQQLSTQAQAAAGHMFGTPSGLPIIPPPPMANQLRPVVLPTLQGATGFAAGTVIDRRTGPTSMAWQQK